MNYLALVSQDIRNELTHYLRGMELIRYAKLFPSVCHHNFWKNRLKKDYDTEGKYEYYVDDYKLCAISEEYGITGDIQEVEEQAIVVAADHCDYELIRFLLGVRNNNNDLFLHAIKAETPDSYNYLWDEYPDYRLRLTIGALLFNHELIEYPRIMDIPSNVMAKWMMTDEKDEAYLGWNDCA